MTESLDVNKIESNWNTFEKLCAGDFSDHNLNKLLDDFARRENNVMCPASSKT